MINQIKLNVKVTKGIWIFAVVSLLVNIIYIAVGDMLAKELPNLLTLLSVSLVLSSQLEYHRLYKQNEVYRLYFTMPVEKKDLIRADYLYHLMMIVSVCALFTTWAFATNQLYMMPFLAVITGLSFILSSVYLYQYGREWFRAVSGSVSVLHLIFFIVTMMFYFWPLKNTAEMKLNLGEGWVFYLNALPFILIVIGVSATIWSYFTVTRNITKTDID